MSSDSHTYNLQRFLAKVEQVFQEPISIIDVSTHTCLAILPYLTHRLVRRSNIRKFRRRLQHLAKEYTEGRIQLEQIKPSVISWISHVQHADSGLRKKIFGEVSFQRG